METTRAKHPALAFLVSLSVAGTCLAVPGLALADTSTADNGSPSDNAAEVVQAAEPLTAAEEAEFGIDDVTATTDSTAADTTETDTAKTDATKTDTAKTDDATTSTSKTASGASETGQASTQKAAGQGSRSGRSSAGAQADTKDIKVDGSTITFAGISLDIPDTFKVMGVRHAMAIAVDPAGDMSVVIGAPDSRGLQAAGGVADVAYFDTVAAALAQGAGIAAPMAEEVQLADDATAYEYVFELTELDEGQTEVEDQVHMVFVPVDDSYAVVQVTVDGDVVSVSDETVDAIIASIRVADDAQATTDDATAAADQKEADAAKAGDAAVADEAAVADAASDEIAEPSDASVPASNPVLADAEKAATEQDEVDAKDRTELADESVTTDKAEATTDKDATTDKAGATADEATADKDATADEATADKADAADKDAVTTDKAEATADDAATDEATADKDAATDETTTDKDATAAESDAASPAADAAGTTETVAGMTFVLPEGLTQGDTSTEDRPVWTNADKSFIVTVKSGVNDAVDELTTGDLDVAALDLADSMDGEVIGSALFENDTTTVYMYAIMFQEDGNVYVGTVGFIPVADNSLNALTGMFKLDDMDTYAPVIEAMYESVTIDE